MLRITAPILRANDANVFMESDLVYENGEQKHLYYSTTHEYAKYLTYEKADSFLLGVLQYAMIIGEDIRVDAPVSERLFFNLTTLVIPTLALALKHKKIDLICEKLDHSILIAEGESCQSLGVGTGCSLGVDSFSTLFYYTSNKIPPSYRITHLTYFNVGANGNDIEKATAAYENDFPMVKEYVSFKQMPLVTLSSNIGSLYKGISPDICLHSRNMGAVLALQKLFHSYIYSSGHTVQDLRLSSKDTAYFETVIIHAFSTENTQFSIGLPCYTRAEKTRYISNFPETYNRLYVCWKQILKNDYNSYSVNEGSKTINCSSCEKCKRTMLALDILDKKGCYESVFDWSFYDKQRDALIGYAMANKNRQGKVFWKELCKLMTEENFIIPSKAKWYKYKYTFLYMLGLQRLIKF